MEIKCYLSSKYFLSLRSTILHIKLFYVQHLTQTLFSYVNPYILLYYFILLYDLFCCLFLLSSSEPYSSVTFPSFLHSDECCLA